VWQTDGRITTHKTALAYARVIKTAEYAKIGKVNMFVTSVWLMGVSSLYGEEDLRGIWSGTVKEWWMMKVWWWRRWTMTREVRRKWGRSISVSVRLAEWSRRLVSEMMWFIRNDRFVTFKEEPGEDRGRANDREWVSTTRRLKREKERGREIYKII